MRRKGANSRQNKIKQIVLNQNNANEYVYQIAKAFGFTIKEYEHGISAYGGNTIRISDHRTYMQTWVSSGAYKSPIRLDIVIEDEPTEGKTDIQNDVEPFTITEFVHKSSDMNIEKVKLIACDILNVIKGKGNGYANNARGEKILLTATHTKSSTLTDSNLQEHTIYNKNKIKLGNNMKRRIRLTEGNLRRLVESALNELDWKTYANAGKKAYDRGQRDRSDRFYNKAIDAYNDKDYYDYDGEGLPRENGVSYMGPNGSYGPCDDVGGMAIHHRDDNDNTVTTGDFGNGGNLEDWDWDDYPEFDDMKKYYTGRSKYTKGKGWENESRRRMVNAITESVIRRLRRR